MVPLSCVMYITISSKAYFAFTVVVVTATAR